MKRNCTRWLCWMLILTLLSSLPLFATKIKEGKDRLDSLTFHAERTWKTSHGKSLESVLNIVPSSILMDFERFNAASGGWWTMTFDTVTGKPQKYEGGVPWIPGTGLGNSLTAADLGVTNLQASTNSIPVDIVSQKAMKFMEEYPELLGVDPGDLVLQKEASGPMLDYLYSLNYQWTYHGIPVEHAHVGFYLNSGNLVMFGQDYISDSIKKLDPRPSITPEIAGEIMWSYLGEKQDINDVMIEHGRLIVQPMVSEEVQNGVEYAPGTGMSYALVYIFVFQRKGVTGTWEARVDAHTGEMISFKDINAYGKIQGGVYKTDKNPWQTDETMPLAFADYGSGVYADSAGLFAGTTGTSTLTGRPGGSGMVGGVDIVDNCGAISLAADGTGLIDFGVSAGTDCTTPGVGGAGNTHSSRTQYYHVTNIKVKAFTYFPSNTWLQGVITDNVNINDTCNAYWSGGATGNANFFRSGGGCGNTGELPGVSLHEVGHGWDYNDGNGFSPEGGTGEVYGDITAMLETHQSCAGGGFWMSYNPGCGTPPSQDSNYHNCGGYGNCCTDCSGIRESDYEKHATPTPATPNGFNLVNCPDGYSCEGPCSRECHCENAPGTQAMWDMVVRDFTASPYNMDLATAWMYADKFWYASAANRLGAFVCGNNTSTAVGNMFNQFRVVDDCDGNLTNGTPHAAGIWAAFSRHQIGDSSAVNTDNDCGCTSLTTPVVSGTAGNQSANLTWPAVTGAASYDIYRNMTSCDAGYTKIGNTASTSYPDSPLSNGVTYYYKVQAKGTGSCPPSAMSNCVTLTPQPCTASILLGQTLYACASTVEVDVLDSTPGSSPWTGVAWSTSDATQRSFTLTGPAPNLSGSFTTTTGAGGPGVVHVANGDTLYVRFVDPDNCGGGSYNANATASIDCTGPTISNVAVTNITGNSATVTWDTNENANSRVTYGTSTPPGTNADNLASYVTSHTINLTGLTPCTQYYFSVTSADVAGNSVTDTNGGSYYTFTTPNTPVTVWSENFTSATPTALPAGWSESHTSGNAWVTNASGCTGNALMYPYNGSAAANSYAYTPGMTLTAGVTYTLSFNQKVYSASYPEIFEVKCGSAATPAGQTITVLASASYTNTTCQALSGNFTVPTTGTYYLSFHCTSAANMWNLYIDDIVLSRPGTCGPDLSYQSNTFEDSCGSGGTGNGDGYIDAGESVTVHPVLMNVGGMATGVSATLSTTTPGITVTTAMASYPDIAPLGTASCNAPHFVYSVGTGVACGTVIDFTLTITAAGGGPWTGNFTHTVGNVIPANGTAYLEDFENISTWSNWTVTTGPGPHTCGPFARVNTASQRPTTGSGYYALSDSDACGSGSTTSTILTSPVIDCSNAAWTAVTLEYDIYYNYYNGDDATVQVYNGSAWQTVWTDTNADLNAHQSINVTTHALGNANFRVRFSYQNASWDYWYAVDNVKVSYTAPPGCNMTACAGGCSNPTQPTIGSVTDLDACAQSGVRVTFTAGSPSTSNSLLVDGAEMATGITSPYDYNPGNTASHSYVVRTYNTASCHTDSTATARADANNTPTPTITGDSANTCPATTVQLSTENGMSSYQWYVGGSPIGGANAYQYTVSASGTYTVSYTNGSGCSGTSAGHAVTISSCAVVPGEVASGGNFTWSGQTMNWTADANATGYRVYRGLLSNLSALCDATNDFCLRNDGAGTSFDVTGDDPAGQSGRCFYFLITGYSGAGEGPAGTATCGTRTVNSSGGCS